MLPQNLEYLCFGYSFNKPLGFGSIPKNIKILKFGRHFDQDISFCSYLDNLIELEFDFFFNQYIPPLPKSLRSLKFGHHFNKFIRKGILPEGLEYLEFGELFGCRSFSDRDISINLEKGSLPNTLKYLKFSERYTYKEDLLDIIPSGLVMLKIYEGLNRQGEVLKLPSTLCIDLVRVKFTPVFQEGTKAINIESNLFYRDHELAIKLPKSLEFLSIKNFSEPITKIFDWDSLNRVKRLHIYSNSGIPIEPGKAPSSIKLIDSDSFYQSLHRILPEGLEILKINYFDQPINSGDLPRTLTVLQLCDFNKPLGKDILPENLRELNLLKFNHPLEKGILPKGLKILKLSSFDHPLEKGILPEGLEILDLHSFNHSLKKDYLPKSLKSLKLDSFNKSLKKDILPEGLENLELGRFSHVIKPNVLPQSLKVLKIITDLFSESPKLKLGSLPPQLEELKLGSKYTRKLKKGVLPSSLKKLTIDYDCSKLEPGVLPEGLIELDIQNIGKNDYIIESDILPKSLKTLIIYNGYYYQCCSRIIFKKGSLPEGLECIKGRYDHYKYRLDYSIDSGILPSSLKRLEIHILNREKEVDISLPEGLEELNISFSSRPTKCIEFPKSLKKLSIDELIKGMKLPEGLEKIYVLYDSTDLALESLPKNLKSLIFSKNNT